MYTLISLPLLFAVLEWYGEYKESRKIIYISKPLVIITLLFWMSIQIDFSRLFSDYDLFPILWFVIGMISCLIGDVFLIFDVRFFIPGLFAFLIGHLFYIVGLGRITPPKQNLLPGLLMLGMILIVSITVYLKLTKGIKESGKERMRFPVLVYSVVISLMLFSAMLTLMDTNWSYISALFVSFGALLFYVSDILNAWVRFISPLSFGRVKIMMTYHLAQIAIGIGVVLHFVYPPDS